VKAKSLEKTLRAVRRISTTMLSDALDRLGIHGTIVGIRPVVESVRMAGPAFTVKEEAHEASPKDFRVTEALEQTKPGDVMVFDVGGYTGASTWGGIATLSAKVRGLAGTVVDGAVRDIAEIRTCRFPVFARAVVPLTGKGRIKTVSMSKPVTCGGVEVKAGHFVVGDDNGLVVIPPAHIHEVLREVKEMEDEEKKIERAIERGELPFQLEKKLKYRI